MTIAEAREKCKSFVARAPRDVFIIGILILASSFSFGLGYLAGVYAGQGSTVSLNASPLVETTSARQVVASKSGTKYYLPECPGVERISEANKVWFASPAAAAAAGYAPATNCKGL